MTKFALQSIVNETVENGSSSILPVAQPEIPFSNCGMFGGQGKYEWKVIKIFGQFLSIIFSLKRLME